MAAANLIPISVETQTVLDRFSNHLYARQGHAQSTVELTTGYARRAIAQIGLDPSHEDVEAYIAGMHRRGDGFSKISNAIKALQRFMEFLGRPILLKKPKKPKSVGVKTLSDAKISVMLAGAKNLRERAMLATLAYSAIRCKELTDLRIRDVELAHQNIVVESGKGGKGRLCCVSGDCVEILGEYLHERDADPDEPLFVTVRHGHKLQTQDVRKIVRVLARRAGIRGRVWPHLFRHSLATALSDRGANVYSIQAQLGHAHASTTMEYYLHPAARNVRADYNRCAPSFV